MMVRFGMVTIQTFYYPCFGISLKLVTPRFGKVSIGKHPNNPSTVRASTTMYYSLSTVRASITMYYSLRVTLLSGMTCSANQGEDEGIYGKCLYQR